ncbi:MAG TPA: serine hydrolase domain-containing protein [Pyrinomonadaceae bacterium]|nr:serine hydrolase domain-containing protein [Pyrinomonadaceae bacterium]
MSGTISQGKLRAAALAALVAVVVIIIIIAPGTASAQQREAARAGMDAERLRMIPARMKSFVERRTTAGAVMLVARRGRVVSLDAVGFQDLESKKPMRPDTIFDTRSVTKVVTAVGIMILMEEGRLALSDPVEKYLPEFKPRGQFKPITIRQLLTHTAGLPLYRLRESEEIAIKRNRTLTDYVTFLSKQEPEFEPGTQFRYMSGGFAILGRIIEVVSGKPYEQFMRERVFEPLGMKDSFFFIPPEKRSRIAAIYRMLDGKLDRWEEIEADNQRAVYPGPEFAMFSTATDLLAFCRMMLDGGTFKGRRILSKLSVETMTQNQTLHIKSAVTQRPVFQGFGWGLWGDPVFDFPLTSRGSFGHNGAFGAIIWIDPEKKLIRIFLQHLLGSGTESNLFMAMAGSAVID